MYSSSFPSLRVPNMVTDTIFRLTSSKGYIASCSYWSPHQMRLKEILICNLLSLWSSPGYNVITDRGSTNN